MRPEYAARKGIDTIVCIGPLACQMYLGAKNLASGNTVLHYTGKKEFLHDLPSLFEAGDTVLVKASNSMKFSRKSWRRSPNSKLTRKMR